MEPGTVAVTKGDATRRRLLDATAADAAEHGLARVSINRVAEAVGLKAGSVYFHFPSKEALVDAMLDAGLIETMAHLDRELAAVGKNAAAAERLAAATRAHLAALHELKPYARVLLASSPQDRSRAPSYHRRLEDYLQRWNDIVGAAQHAGVVEPRGDSRFVRDCIFGALNQTIRSASSAGMSVDTMTDLAFGLFARR